MVSEAGRALHYSTRHKNFYRLPRQCRIETLVQGVKHAAAPKMFNAGTQPSHRGDLGAFMEFNTAAKSVTDVGRIHAKTFLLVV